MNISWKPKMKLDSQKDIATGAIFENKYKIGRIIGSGGMGRVYEAVHVILNRRVAVKCLHAHHASDKIAVQRFVQEAKLAASIEHNNICEVIDFGTGQDGTPYLVMPLLEGLTLSELFDREKQIPMKQLINIICQTLSALSAVHGARIVHRDLKPENIFLGENSGRFDSVKLLDFGISKILDQDSVSHLTRTGAVLGTPHYMSPEQACGQQIIDHRADIFTMGTILYEGLTGVKPYVGHSYNEIIFKIVAGSYQSLRILNPSIPTAIEQIVLKAMSKDPADRFSNAEEMRKALKQGVSKTKPETNDPLVLVSSKTLVERNSEFVQTNIENATPSTSANNFSIVPSTLSLKYKQSRTRGITVLATLILVVFSIGRGVVAALSSSDYQTINVPIDFPTNEKVSLDIQPPEVRYSKLVSIDYSKRELDVAALEPDSYNEQSLANAYPKPSKNPPLRHLGGKERARRGLAGSKVLVKEKLMRETKNENDYILEGRFGTRFVAVF